MKKFGLLLLFSFVAITWFGCGSKWFGNKGNESPTPDVIEWVTIQEAEQLMEKKANKDKKLMVDLYTDWCGWCKKMDASTFTDKEVTAYLNEHYIAVKMNAETEETITFNGKEYQFMPGGRKGTNMLAIELGAVNGRIGYPTLVFLNSDLQKIQAVPGYQTPDKLLPMLEYFGENHHLTTPWEQYQQRYQEMQNSGEFRD